MDDREYDYHEVDNRRNSREERERRWGAVADRMADDLIETEKRLQEMILQTDWDKRQPKKNCKLS